ncbi:MAG: rhodanese-like domain-containing protein [Alkalispirochaetaceae bacterium]
MSRLIPILLAVTVVLFLAARLAAQQTTDPSLNRYATPDGLKELIESEDKPYLLVDVRTAAEYNGGHIPTAINVPFQTIGESLPETEGDPILIVYCRTGRRSGVAFRTLKNQGYERVVDFGGILRWEGEIEG